MSASVMTTHVSARGLIALMLLAGSAIARDPLPSHTPPPPTPAPSLPSSAIQSGPRFTPGDVVMWAMRSTDGQNNPTPGNFNLSISLRGLLLRDAEIHSATRHQDGTLLLLLMVPTQPAPAPTSTPSSPSSPAPRTREPVPGRMAIIRSIDDGRTWSEPSPLNIESLPAGALPISATLTTLSDGAIRLYFVAQPLADASKVDGAIDGLQSAISRDVGRSFSYEVGQRLPRASLGSPALAPSVARMGSSFVAVGSGIVARSTDGLAFDQLPRDPTHPALAGALLAFNGQLVAYAPQSSDSTRIPGRPALGTRPAPGENVAIARMTSRDGRTWSSMPAMPIPGRRPAAILLPDGTELLITTVARWEDPPKSTPPNPAKPTTPPTDPRLPPSLPDSPGVPPHVPPKPIPNIPPRGPGDWSPPPAPIDEPLDKPR
jgi:hypothetical protein